MQFKDVIAQDELKKQLIQMAQNDKVSQAMLFLGAEGVGKLAMALAFAQYLNCSQPSDTDSCGVCSNCIKNEKFIHPDLFFTFPTIGSKVISNQFIEDWRAFINQSTYRYYKDWLAILQDENKLGNITAKECEQIVKTHSLKHFEGKYKIHIIWGAEYLKKEGNRLLKLIEEPPANTVFILIAQSQESLLPTIMSRTQIVKFNKLNNTIILEQLQRQFDCENERATRIAQIADGNWTSALALLDQKNIDYFKDFREWMLTIFQLNAKPHLTHAKHLMDWCEEMSKIGRQNQRAFLQYSLFFIREAIIAYQQLPSKLENMEKEVGVRMVERISWEKMIDISQIINNLHYQIIRNVNAKNAFIGGSMKIMHLQRNN